MFSGYQPIWDFSEDDIRILEGRGTDFTSFVDSLIFCNARICGIPSSDIRTNLAVTHKDEGVDSEVLSGSPDDPTGWMKIPTVWQHRSSKSNATEAVAEITNEKHEHLRKRIRDGFGYRYCVCDPMVPAKISRIEEALSEETIQLCANAPPPMVLDSNALAKWASDYSTVVARFRPQALSQNALRFDNWKSSCQHDTPRYVEVDKWPSIREQLIDHVNLGLTPQNVAIILGGDSGVGKTRFIMETLAVDNRSNSLVLYCKDETDSRHIANLLANGTWACIFILDEVSSKSLCDIRYTLNPHKDRVRVIAIGRDVRRPQPGEAQIWLSPLESKTVGSIIKANFPQIAETTRDAIAHNSGGLPREAIYACQCENPENYLRSGGGWAHAKSLLSENETKSLMALSLVGQVGYKDEVMSELDELCSHLGLAAADMRDSCTEIADRLGVVSTAGRFFVIDSALIANGAFQEAWRRFAVHNVEAFLNTFPRSLLPRFLHRASQAGTDEMRREIAGFFKVQFRGRDPSELRNPEVCKLMSLLAEAEPATYMRVVREFIEKASLDTLLQVTSTARRELVWLCEKLAWFPEHFDDAQAILLQLALAESEHNIANNATAIWCQLYRLTLPGTAVSYPTRLKRLRDYLSSQDESITRLAVSALATSLEGTGMRMNLGPIVAGRIIPEEWHPATNVERSDCFLSALRLLVEISRDGQHSQSTYAKRLLTEHMRTLLLGGFLDEVRPTFKLLNLNDDELQSLRDRISNFLKYDKPRDASERDNQESRYRQSEQYREYYKRVEDWLKSLSPGDYHDRLVQLIKAERWEFFDEQHRDTFPDSARDIALEAMQNPKLLENELHWIIDGKNINAPHFGQALGELDENGIWFEPISSVCIQSDSIGLLQGYIAALSRKPQHVDLCNSLIDELEETKPDFAFDLAIMNPAGLKAVERAIRLVKNERISFERMRAFEYSKDLGQEDFIVILDALSSGWHEPIDYDAVRAGIALIHGWTYDLKQHKAFPSRISLEEFTTHIWSILEAALHVENLGHEAWEWEQLVEDMANTDYSRAVDLAARALVAPDYSLENQSVVLFAKLAEVKPANAMQSLGKVILAPHGRRAFMMLDKQEVLLSLPVDTVKGWLRENGATAAAIIARGLEKPYISEDGVAVVPELTEWVFTEFENSDEVFDEFCCGTFSYSWAGDAIEQCQKRIDTAKRFREHPVKRIRQWAKQAVEDFTRFRDQHKRDEEEFSIE